jgi:hypothetical protein
MRKTSAKPMSGRAERGAARGFAALLVEESGAFRD